MLSPANKFPAGWVLLVLTAALILRLNALWLPHWRGDQAHYVILAMKLDRFGLDGYNLRRAALGVLDAGPGKDHRVELTAVKSTPDDVPGMYLEMIKGVGQAYYDEPLHVRAPLLPAMLALSHRLIAGPGKPFLVLSYGYKLGDSILASWRVWILQLWAAIIPLLFNLGLIALTALLAWMIFGSKRITVYAAALLASNPLSIWLAHRILTEDPAAFWVTASFTTLAFCRSKYGVVPSALAGLFAGLAVLTNQRVGLATLAAAGFVGVTLWQDGAVGLGLKNRWWNGLRRIVRSPFFWAYTSAFLLVTGFWFARVIRVYGEPLHQPLQGIALAHGQDMTGWFAAVMMRPHASLLFALGVPLLCPLFGAAYATWGNFWSGVLKLKTDPSTRGTMLLWMWALVFYLYLADLSSIFAIGNKEHRYFYPAYPAIAVLAASGLERMRQWIGRCGHRRSVSDTAVVLMLLANALWGCRLAYPKIFNDQMLF